MNGVKDLIVLPSATGMALTMTLLALKAKNPKGKYVVWPRIDQKTCLKCIYTANLIAIPIEPEVKGDELLTSVEGI